MKLVPLVVCAFAGGSACTKKTQENTTPAASSTATSTATATLTSTGTAQNTDPIAAGQLAISTLEALPSVIDPVLPFDGDDSSLDADVAAAFDDLAVETGLTTLAETGAVLGRKVADLNAAFNAAENPSRAMCDTVNQSMKFVFEAGSPDFMACVIKGAGLSKDEALYSGTDKVYEFVAGMGGETRRFLVKINIKRRGEGIERFSFHSCSDESGEFKQQQYFVQQMFPESMSINSKMTGPTGSISILQLSSKVNAEGKLRGLKTIEYHDTNTKSGEERYVHSQVTQSPKHILYNGYSSDNGGTQYFSFYELIDGNTYDGAYAATKLAVGDGAALVRMNGESNVQGWNGDTFSIDENQVRIAKVKDRENQLIPPLTEANPDYAADEVFDCSKSGAVEVELPTSVVEDCMARFEIDQDGSQFCTGIQY
jgi:hypothetical protein